MTPASSDLVAPGVPQIQFIKERIEREVDAVLGLFQAPSQLSAEQRRGILARYVAVLEGNFIYWMTGAYLAVGTDAARAIILDNLHEEIRDSHPLMLRRFAVAAHAFPSDADAMAVDKNLTNVRLFIGKLSGVQIVAMMAFFECLIQRLMPYLAELARLQGSDDMEYTDVHGVCDIAHTDGLFRSLESEIALKGEKAPAEADLYDGVKLLRTLLQNIITG